MISIGELSVAECSAGDDAPVGIAAEDGGTPACACVNMV